MYTQTKNTREKPVKMKSVDDYLKYFVFDRQCATTYIAPGCKKPPKQRSLLHSFRYAISGLGHVLKTQRNMRIHIIIGSAVILLALFMKFSLLEITVLTLTIMFVLVCEVINTALEISLDFLNGKEYHPTIKIIKDVVAGGVLLASINAVIIGAILFFRHIL